MTLTEIVKQARRWEAFGLRRPDGTWELVQHLFFDEFWRLNGWGQFGHNFPQQARELLSSDRWEFVMTEEEYQSEKKILDQHFHVR